MCFGKFIYFKGIGKHYKRAHSTLGSIITYSNISKIQRLKLIDSKIIRLCGKSIYKTQRSLSNCPIDIRNCQYHEEKPASLATTNSMIEICTHMTACQIFWQAACLEF